MQAIAPTPLYVALLSASMPSVAAPLEPYQQAALEQILATMDGETRSFAEPQLVQMLAAMGEAEVEMLLAASG